jgi:hypothetical protein
MFRPLSSGIFDCVGLPRAAFPERRGITAIQRDLIDQTSWFLRLFVPNIGHDDQRLLEGDSNFEPLALIRGPLP